MSLSDRTAIVWKGLDLYVGLAAGAVAALSATSAPVRKAGVTVLLAEAAVGVALLSLVLGALAILTPALDGPYRRVLDTLGGVGRAFAPFKVVAFIAGTTAIAAMLAALAWPELGATVQTIAIALVTCLSVWAIAGTVSLVGMALFHAEQRANLLQGVDDAEAAVRARRVTTRERQTPPV